jgi:tryptophan synthase alpha chain
MSRIDDIFAALKARQGKALMPFLTAGDPDIATTGKLIAACESAGASICEIGLPFSDPIADGPVIQASMTHALASGLKQQDVMKLIADLRPTTKLGLVAMVSYSIVYRMGGQSFIKRAADAGFDGFIFPDLPLEESETIRKQVADTGLSMSMLIAPTTPIERAKAIAKASSGFVYLLARAGITGERNDLPPDLSPRIEQLRKVTDLPIAVGFGIANADHVRQVVSVGDAAIVGSAIMRRVAQHRDKGGDAVASEVGRFVRELAVGLDVHASA